VVTGELKHACHATLQANWREGERDGTRYSYTAPSSGRYPWQWYWDSCFTAIAWRRFDPARSRAELATLLAAAEPDGFIGHTIFWGEQVSLARSLFYNLRSRRDFMTATIQPPLLAWAWRIAVGDPTEVPAITRHHDWMERERSLDDDGLLWIIQPDESGLDASPKFDSAFGWRADGLPGFPLLVRRNRRLDFDVRRIARAGGPIVCGASTNVLHGLSRLALGRPSITPKLLERLYDERRGVFHQLLSTRAHRDGVRHRPVTWSSLSPLALPDLPQDIGRRLVEEQLLNPRRFWLPVPPPSVSAEEATFSNRDRFLFLRRYWRGTTWINAGWLVWLGLVRLGYRDEAAELAHRLGAAVSAAGLREYYDPFTGAGMGATGFSWSALIMELVDPDPLAACSHLPRKRRRDHSLPLCSHPDSPRTGGDGREHAPGTRTVDPSVAT
jgi:Mannosylglycerate hydrolase MGH1-like glycoside hydrolase domain